jgi:hypothetical protein
MGSALNIGEGITGELSFHFHPSTEKLNKNISNITDLILKRFLLVYFIKVLYARENRLNK